jgi:hypothetical protein
MLGNAQMMEGTAPNRVVVTRRLEKLITDVVKSGRIFVVVMVMAVKTVVTFPFEVTAVDQPTSRDVDSGGNLIVVGTANVVGGNTNMQGGGQTAV